MIKDFKALKLSIASPQQILGWSHGEVKKAETINYRTHRAEVDGLMDESTFGPTRNYECYCGKYKKIRYKGIVCDKCGVEVTHKRVRRERMGHIKLASPVVHVWYSYGVPNKLALLLNVPQKRLETVIYFARYIVTEIDTEKQSDVIAKITEKQAQELEQFAKELETETEKVAAEFRDKAKAAKKELTDKKKADFALNKLANDEKKQVAKIKSLSVKKEEATKTKFQKLIELISGLKAGSSLSEEELSAIREHSDEFVTVGMGAEAIKHLLTKLDLEKEVAMLKEEKLVSKSVLKKKKIVQRLRVLEGMYKAGIKPEWVVMDVLPVIPPDLRPIIQLPGGRFATSDLNDLYRRVINRNSRLKRLMDLGAPEIILRNEKRMLQESVDALIDNSHRMGNPVLNTRGQAYKSLSDMLRGKQGRFRQNLLGKRVDYSGRSVIAPGPNMTINQCGLPKTMALELFRPFVLREIIADGLAPNIKSAKHLFESKSAEIWEILERVIKDRPVLLNRAPTLHKQGIQAFYPMLVEGNAIRLHPMVCKGFNADFDGDQMAVHVPLSEKAVQEAREKMFAVNNLLHNADGSPLVNADRDMSLGVYYMTSMDSDQTPKSYSLFADPIEVIGRYQMDILDLREPVRVVINGKVEITSAGRIIFNESLPEGHPFVNATLNKKDIGKISAKILTKYGPQASVDFLNKIEELGFKYATISGVTVGMEDFIVSPQKDVMLGDVENKDDQLTSDYYNGLLTAQERKRLSEQLWMDLIDRVSKDSWEQYNKQKDNNLVILESSGALPVQQPLRQISGIRGLILDPSGNIVELPLRSNYKQGLSTFEFFVAARGTRKGLADTALRTAESGYLTRRLVDVAQDVITKEEDCGSNEGRITERKSNRKMEFADRITGRVPSEDIANPKTGEIIVKKNEWITAELAEQINSIEEIESVTLRSVLHCQTVHGVCQKCYGYHLGTKKPVELGIAVGVIAAQSMGEAATQLTLDNKHFGGAARTDITQGLPRVEELFEARTPKAKALISEISGKVHIIKDENGKPSAIAIKDRKQMQKTYTLVEGDKASVKRSKKVKKNDLIYTKADGEEILATYEGTVTVEQDKIIYIVDKEIEVEYPLGENDVLTVENADNVIKGQTLTTGSKDPKEIMKLLGLDAAQDYLISSTQETFGIQGIGMDDKHVEIIIRQMTRLARILDAGESEALPGDYVDVQDLAQINNAMKEQGKEQIKLERTILGITTAAIKTDSFLSAASFEQQVRVLSDAAIVGKMDHLRGLKENVIIGRTVPLGEEVR